MGCVYVGSYSCRPSGLEHPYGKWAVALETAPGPGVGSGRLVLEVSMAWELAGCFFGVVELVQTSVSGERQRVSFLLRIKPPCCAVKIFYMAQKGALTDSPEPVTGE